MNAYWLQYQFTEKKTCRNSPLWWNKNIVPYRPALAKTETFGCRNTWILKWLIRKQAGCLSGGDRSEWSEELQGSAAPCFQTRTLPTLDNRNTVLCGIPNLQPHLQYELLKQTQKMWDWLHLNDHLDEFHSVKGLKPPTTAQCFADCSLSDASSPHALISASGTWGRCAHDTQRLSDFNFFNIDVLHYVSAVKKMYAALEGSTQHTTGDFSATETPSRQPRHANTTRGREKAGGNKQRAEGNEKSNIISYKQADYY